MNVLIYGAGAIGCHIGYCMYKAGHRVVLVCRGRHYEQIKKHGMHITICDNEVVQHNQTIREDHRFIALDDLAGAQGPEFDCIFITLKLMDYDTEALSVLTPFMKKNTAVVPPCTELPFWWFYNLQGKARAKYNDVEFDTEKSRFFKKTNIISMTMWLSAVIEKPGHVIVKHIQRGYPIAALYPVMEAQTATLRDIFNKTCVSPSVRDIRSEIFIKAVNSFAFNLVAIDTEYTNLELSHDEAGKDSVKTIMLEGDQILELLGIPIIQSVESRINQTLSSTKHTMSMLHAFQNGKPIELGYQWGNFDKISKVLGIEMPFSKMMYEKVMEKVSSSVPVSSDMDL